MMQVVTYTIPNISCGHCVQTIQTELGELEGITRVEASHATQQVTVEYAPPASEENIISLLEEIYYPPAQETR